MDRQVEDAEAAEAPGELEPTCRRRPRSRGPAAPCAARRTARRPASTSSDEVDDHDRDLLPWPAWRSGSGRSRSAMGSRSMPANFSDAARRPPAIERPPHEQNPLAGLWSPGGALRRRHGTRPFAPVLMPPVTALSVPPARRRSARREFAGRGEISVVGRARAGVCPPNTSGGASAMARRATSAETA